MFVWTSGVARGPFFQLFETVTSAENRRYLAQSQHDPIQCTSIGKYILHLTTLIMNNYDESFHHIYPVDKDTASCRRCRRTCPCIRCARTRLPRALHGTARSDTPPTPFGRAFLPPESSPCIAHKQRATRGAHLDACRVCSHRTDGDTRAALRPGAFHARQ